jgi:hypothetical protein
MWMLMSVAELSVLLACFRSNTDIVNTGYNGAKDVNLEPGSTRFFQVCQVLGGATPGRPSFMGFIRVFGSVALYAAVIGLDAYWAVQRFQFAHGAAVLSYATVVMGCVAFLDWKACGRRWPRRLCRRWRARPASALSGCVARA